MTCPPPSDERRHHRSSDPTEALWLYLSNLARRLGSEAITVSTREGVLLGGVGDGHDLDLLVALAAIGSRGHGDEADVRYAAGELRSCSINLGSRSVLLSSVGGEPLPVRECAATLRRIQALAA